KLPHDRMFIGVELCHCSNKHKIAFVQKSDVIGHFLCAIGDIVCNNHLRETELTLHFSNKAVDGLRPPRILQGGWIIVKNGVRLSSNTAGNGHSALQSSAEFAGHEIAETLNFDEF